MSDIEKIKAVIKAEKLMFNSLCTKEEIQMYLNTEGHGIEQVKEHFVKMGDHKQYNKIPVCVLSHMFDARRSKFLTQLKSEHKLRGLDRDYYIFILEDQKDLYKEFSDIGVNLVYVEETEEYSGLCGKRQFIYDWCLRNNHDHGFFIEDDCFDFILPVGAFGKTGSFRNKRFNMSFSMTFSFWEYLILSQGLQYSGPVNNMEFAFRNLADNPFIKHLAQTVQAVHIGVKYSNDKGIRFDKDSGWDDYDMIINQCINGQGTHGIIFSYNTPSLKSGVSAMSNSAEALAKRCEINTTALIKKWGLSLVREDTKKGLYNAKVHWFNIRKCYNENLDLSILPNKTNEEAKIAIKELLSK